MAQAPQYLDAQGNPITPRQAAQYLDAQGNPIAPRQTCAPRTWGDTARSVWNWITEPPSLEKLNTMLEPLAHPQTAGDIASLLTVGVDPLRKMAVGATAARQTGEAWTRTRESAAPFTETLLKRKLGLDPDAIDLQSARLRLQAARSRTRQAAMRRQMAGVGTTEDTTVTAAKARGITEDVAKPIPEGPSDTAVPPRPATTVPEETTARATIPDTSSEPISASPSTSSSESAAPSAPQSTRARRSAPTPRRAKNTQAILQSFADLNPTAEELVQAKKWIDAGVDPQVVLQRLRTTRELTGRLGTPSEDLKRQAIEYRNTHDDWPDWWTGPNKTIP